MVNDLSFGSFLVLRRQKLIEHAVEGREFPHFLVADQIGAVEARVDRLQASQIPVIAEQVAQQPGGNLVPLRATAGCHPAHRRKQAFGREPALGNDFFDPIALLPRDQCVLELLGIDARRVLGQQGHGFVGRDDVRKNTFLVQQAGPQVQASLAVAAFVSRVVAVARTHQRHCVLGDIQNLVGLLLVRNLLAAHFAQKIQRQPPEICKAVGILIEVTEHVVVFAAQIIVAAVFGKDQRVQEKTVVILGNFPEQRAARARQRLFLDFP